MNLLKIYFVRHGTTVLNQKGIFCGRTDALLAPEGWEELAALKEEYDYPEVERVYCSPAIRCIETASVLYPGMEPVLKEGLWELDFGNDEKKPASEFIGTDFYDSFWIAQKPDCVFDGGESLLEAKFRVLSAMTRIVMECRTEDIHTIAVVAHGAIFARLMMAALVPDEYKDAFLLCPNGMGVTADVDMDSWFYEQELRFDKYLPEGAPRLQPEDSPYFSNDE